jgi:hypothetical protein
LFHSFLSILALDAIPTGGIQNRPDHCSKCGVIIDDHYFELPV